MPERKCLVPFEYAGRKRQVGEVFVVEPDDVVLLSTLGWIEADEGYKTRAMSAGQPAQYRTRDLKSKAH